MPTDQYHEPPDELSQEVRTFARVVASLQEEAEAIGWYEQRISLEKDAQAIAIMKNAQQEEFKHFAMALEFLTRRTPKWRVVLKDVLFKEGDIVELDVNARQLNMRVSDEELARRRAAWRPRNGIYPRGYGKLFLQHIKQADEGCDFDFLEGTAPIPEPEIH